MRSSATLGVVFVVLGGLSVSGIGGRHALVPAAWILAGLLCVAGALLFTQRRPAFYFALAVAALTVLSGIIAMLGHPNLSLPVPPPLAIGVGLYLVLRTSIAASFAKGQSRGFAPRDPQP
jgi:hypothetical protein